MIKEKQNPVDLTTLENDEIFNIGIMFLKEFKKLIDTYKPYFGSFEIFNSLEKLYSMFSIQLSKDERSVA